MPETQDFVESL
jgi:hypothetical protein